MNQLDMSPEQLAQYYMQQSQGGEGGGAFGGGAPSSGPAQGGAFGGAAPGAAQQQGGLSSGRGMFGQGYVDMGNFGRALQAASFAPGPLGMVAGLANAGVRANNLGITDEMRKNMDMPGLSFGQVVGGMLGLNDYGGQSGYIGDKNIGGNDYGISIGGGMVGDRTTLDPTEAANRAGMAAAMAGRDLSTIGNGVTSGLGGGESEGGGAFGGHDPSGYGGGEAGTNTGDTKSESYYADGGYLRPQEGAFIFPADVVSALGKGSTNAGAAHLRKKYGGELIEGDGDGRSDDVPAGAFRFSDGEVYIPRQGVERAGGADKLHKMVLDTRKNAVNTMRNLPPPKR